MPTQHRSLCFFFFNDTATTEIYTLSLHDALPIYRSRGGDAALVERRAELPREIERLRLRDARPARDQDRKSTRLNSSHLVISYAVFCLKKKKQKSHATSDSRDTSPAHAMSSCYDC